jgi:muramoyltetrapeptide carboxypeptidase
MSPLHKPPALHRGNGVNVVSLASPVDEKRLNRGWDELARLGYVVKGDRSLVLAREGFFAGSKGDRVRAFKEALCDTESRAIFSARGGYGSNYLLDALNDVHASPKILCGYSDITSLQIFLRQKFNWPTFYGPMVASGLDRGADSPGGYDRASFIWALTQTDAGWTVELLAETIIAGAAEGILLGGCLSLLETTLGTAWEVDTKGAILILEDRDMKAYQVDRALMHLKHAGKFEGVTGVVLGEFPETDAPAGTETVKDVARRILAPFEMPVVWGAPIGHTERPMLTLPLGVRARLLCDDSAKLEILEPAVV